MKKYGIIALAALLSASFPVYAQRVILEASPPPVVVQQPVVVQPQPYCREYTDKFTIGNEVRISRGIACLQPDGAWQLQPSNAGVNYITRGGQIYVTSPQPFAGIVIDDHHRHHDHW